jgi:hypothetical protein
VVTKIASDCGCFRVVRNRLEIPGGRTGRLEVTFHPVDDVERTGFKIAFQTNDPHCPTGVVQVHCKVLPPLALEPSVCLMMPGAGGSTETVTVINHSPRPARLLYASTDRWGLTVKVPRQAIAPAGRSTVIVTAEANTTPSELRGLATIAHDLPGVPALKLRIKPRPRERTGTGH